MFKELGSDARELLAIVTFHIANNAHSLAYGIELQAYVLYYQGRIDEGKSQYLRAAECFVKIGATGDAKRCRDVYNQSETYQT